MFTFEWIQKYFGEMPRLKREIRYLTQEAGHLTFLARSVYYGR